MNGPITRKEFLSTAKTAIAAASVGAIGMAAVEASGQSRQMPLTAPTAAAIPPWPWPYRKLDTEDVRKRAHKAYYDGGCGYGAFSGLLGALIDVVGEPFTLMPPQIMYFAGGGGAGWGTLCGALNGSATLINLVVDRTNANSIIGELFGWYTEAPFPSDISNDYAQRRVFLVNRNDRALQQTQAGSPLCHASVSSWCTETHYAASSAERAERCARLTGDVAARAVELLNAFADGNFRAVFRQTTWTTGCQSCHSGHIANVQSTVKMNCPQCHNDSWKHTY